jgi:hypothetical protein
MVYYVLNETEKYWVDVALIGIIVLINIHLLIRKFLTDKNNKAFLEYFKEIYSDFIKYLCIELGISASEYIEKGEFSLIGSLARISIVMLALLVYHEIKYNFFYWVSVK